MISNPLYLEDIEYTASCKLNWDRLKNSTVMISGAGGLIGSLVIDVIMYKNEKESYILISSPNSLFQFSSSKIIKPK